MKIILPQLLCGTMEDVEIAEPCCNLKEIFEVINENYPQYSQKLFLEDGRLKKNVILVLNGKIISKGLYEQLHFDEKSKLEIFLQLAGG